MRLSSPAAAAVSALLMAACQAPSGSGAAAPGGEPRPPSAATTSASPTATATPTTAPAPSPTPTPPLPRFYIETLRARPHGPSTLQVGDVMFRGPGFTKYRMSWASGGQTMTGTISVPDGDGPFPVVIVNHGHIPAERYWVGQDSGIFGDPMAAHGFISAAPDYPGHAGSGPGDRSVDSMTSTVLTVMDLMDALDAFPRADMKHLAAVGHSFGGGVVQELMVTDPRVKAAALYAPVSSDAADNARKWWLSSNSAGPLGDPSQNPEGYAHVTPRNYFTGATPPAILLQGTRDEDIPAPWTVATRDALASRGAKTDLVWFDGAMHDMVGTDLARANTLAEDWIRKGLGL